MTEIETLLNDLRVGAKEPCDGCCYGEDMTKAADLIERLQRRVTVLEMVITQDLDPWDCSDQANLMIVEELRARAPQQQERGK